MAAQLDYQINANTAYPGLIAYLDQGDDRISRTVETPEGIPFGAPVEIGTDPNKQCILANGTGLFLGITYRSLEREAVNRAGDISYQFETTAGILRTGYIWAICTTTSFVGQLVKYVHATGELAAGDALVGETQIIGAQWETVTAVGELGLIRMSSSIQNQ